MTPKAGMVQLDTDTFTGEYFTGKRWITFTWACLVNLSDGVTVVPLN